MASDKLPAPFTGDQDQYLGGDDSFATYLAHVRESFSNANSRSSSFQSFPNNNTNPNTTTTSSSSSSSNKVELHSELDVFGAEKYFSGILDRRRHHPQPNHHHHDNGNNIKGVSTCSSEEEESTNSCTGFLGVKYVSSSSSCSGRQRSFFSVFRCYCTPKSAVKEETEEDIRCRIDAKTTPSDFRRSLDVTRVERCIPLHKDASSELFEISSVHSMK